MNYLETMIELLNNGRNCDAQGIHTRFYKLNEKEGVRLNNCENVCRLNHDAQVRLHAHNLAPAVLCPPTELPDGSWFYVTEVVTVLKAYYWQIYRITGKDYSFGIEIENELRKQVEILAEELKKINYPTADNHFGNIGIAEHGLVLIDFSDEIWNQK